MTRLSWLRAGLTRGSRLALAAVALLGMERSAAAWGPACEKTERFTLGNGVEVVLLREARLPMVAVVSSVHVGARDDPPGYEGLAHYVEHLTFGGSPQFPSAMDLYEQIGATGLNATTTADTTDYHALVPSSQIERALWIEARRLGIGLNTIADEKAVSEQRVLLREHQARNGYEPGYILAKATYTELYPAADHPYHSMFPSPESIERLTLGGARWFFGQHYRTDATRLVLVGDFEPGAVKALIEKYFGALAAPVFPRAEGSKGGACHWAKVARDVGGQRIVQQTRQKTELLELLWPVAPAEKAQELGMRFSSLRGQLGEAMEQTGLSHRVREDRVELELGGYWALSVSVAPGQPFEKVEALVRKVLQDHARSTGEDDVVPKRQRLELSEDLVRAGLLRRAQALARRECTASACVDLTRHLTTTDPIASQRFAIEGALIVERRHSVGASEDGDLEVMR
jgi:predicted Zn-dependent peptidase